MLAFERLILLNFEENENQFFSLVIKNLKMNFAL